MFFLFDSKARTQIALQTHEKNSENSSIRGLSGLFAGIDLRGVCYILQLSLFQRQRENSCVFFLVYSTCRRDIDGSGTGYIKCLPTVLI